MPPSYSIQWTSSDEQRLFALQASIGNQWSELSNLFSDKSSNDCKNRYNSGLRKVERSLRIGQNEAAALLARYALAIKHKIAGGEAGDDARFEDGLIELAGKHKGPYSQLLPAVKSAASAICSKVIRDEKIGFLATGRRPSLVSESSSTPITTSASPSTLTSTPRSLLTPAPLSSSASSRLSPQRKRSRPTSQSQSSPSAMEIEGQGYDSDTEVVLRPAKMPKRRVGRPSKVSSNHRSSLLHLLPPLPTLSSSSLPPPRRRRMIEAVDDVEIGEEEETAADALFSFRQ